MAYPLPLRRINPGYNLPLVPFGMSLVGFRFQSGKIYNQRDVAPGIPGSNAWLGSEHADSLHSPHGAWPGSVTVS